MFAAMKSGDLDVKFIPKNDREARVIIKNNSKRPLNVRLPEAFAGVPVLPQRGGGRGGAGGGGQGMGGGMGGGGGGMGGMGGGMFNVPAEGLFPIGAEQTKQIFVELVCLEHGKKDPRPGMPYEIKPIESLTTKPGVAELCTMLGYGKIDQRAAQVAAWHLNNDMSWDQLASKRIEHLTGPSEPYFSFAEMQGGMVASDAAIAMAQEAKQAKAASSSNSEPASTPSTGAVSESPANANQRQPLRKSGK